MNRMHPCFSVILVFLVLAAFLLGGCDDSKSTSGTAKGTHGLGIPIDVDWAVSPDATSFTLFYTFKPGKTPSEGMLIVESSGKILRQLPYDIVDSETIRFKDGQGGPHVWAKGAMYSGSEITSILTLKKPPAELRVTRTLPKD